MFFDSIWNSGNCGWNVINGPHKKTHTWLHAAHDCPAAYGWGHWWRNGCRFHSCWPECSCKSFTERKGVRTDHTVSQSEKNTSQTHRSKKAASSLLRRTLCLVPALTWQFISWAREMYTLVPVKRNNHLKWCEASFILMYMLPVIKDYDKLSMTHQFAWTHANYKNDSKRM